MKGLSRRWRFLVFALCLPLPMSATLISYTMTGDLTGTLGTAPITAASFTFVFVGDTTGIYSSPPDVLLNPAISNSISITGFGSGQFTEGIVIGVNPVGGIGGFSTPILDLRGITFLNAGFVGWDLATPIGPLGNATPPFADGSFATSIGALDITGASNLTFRADAVPEPATLALIGAGMLLLTLLRRK